MTCVKFYKNLENLVEKCVNKFTPKNRYKFFDQLNKLIQRSLLEDLSLSSKINIISSSLSSYINIRSTFPQENSLQSSASIKLFYLRCFDLFISTHQQLWVLDDLTSKNLFLAVIQSSLMKARQAGLSMDVAYLTSLDAIAGDPWGHPVLGSILREEELTDEEALEFLTVNEQPESLRARMKFLINNDRLDLTFNLLRWSLRHPANSRDVALITLFLHITCHLSFADLSKNTKVCSDDDEGNPGPSSSETRGAFKAHPSSGHIYDGFGSIVASSDFPFHLGSIADEEVHERAQKRSFEDDDDSVEGSSLKRRRTQNELENSVRKEDYFQLASANSCSESLEQLSTDMVFTDANFSIENDDAFGIISDPSGFHDIEDVLNSTDQRTDMGMDFADIQNELLDYTLDGEMIKPYEDVYYQTCSKISTQIAVQIFHMTGYGFLESPELFQKYQPIVLRTLLLIVWQRGEISDIAKLEMLIGKWLEVEKIGEKHKKSSTSSKLLAKSTSLNNCTHVNIRENFSESRLLETSSHQSLLEGNDVGDSTVYDGGGSKENDDNSKRVMMTMTKELVDMGGKVWQTVVLVKKIISHCGEQHLELCMLILLDLLKKERFRFSATVTIRPEGWPGEEEVTENLSMVCRAFVDIVRLAGRGDVALSCFLSSAFLQPSNMSFESIKNLFFNGGWAEQYCQEKSNEGDKHNHHHLFHSKNKLYNDSSNGCSTRSDRMEESRMTTISEDTMEEVRVQIERLRDPSWVSKGLLWGNLEPLMSQHYKQCGWVWDQKRNLFRKLRIKKSKEEPANAGQFTIVKKRPRGRPRLRPSDSDSDYSIATVTADEMSDDVSDGSSDKSNCGIQTSKKRKSLTNRDEVIISYKNIASCRAETFESDLKASKDRSERRCLRRRQSATLCHIDDKRVNKASQSLSFLAVRKQKLKEKLMQVKVEKERKKSISKDVNDSVQHMGATAYDSASSVIEYPERDLSSVGALEDGERERTSNSDNPSCISGDLETTRGIGGQDEEMESPKNTTKDVIGQVDGNRDMNHLEERFHVPAESANPNFSLDLKDIRAKDINENTSILNGSNVNENDYTEADKVLSSDSNMHDEGKEEPVNAHETLMKFDGTPLFISEESSVACLKSQDDLQTTSEIVAREGELSPCATDACINHANSSVGLLHESGGQPIKLCNYESVSSDENCITEEHVRRTLECVEDSTSNSCHQKDTNVECLSGINTDIILSQSLVTVNDEVDCNADRSLEIISVSTLSVGEGPIDKDELNCEHQVCDTSIPVHKDYPTLIREVITKELSDHSKNAETATGADDCEVLFCDSPANSHFMTSDTCSQKSMNISDDSQSHESMDADRFSDCVVDYYTELGSNRLPTRRLSRASSRSSQRSRSSKQKLEMFCRNQLLDDVKLRSEVKVSLPRLDLASIVKRRRLRIVMERLDRAPLSISATPNSDAETWCRASSSDQKCSDAIDRPLSPSSSTMVPVFVPLHSAVPSPSGRPSPKSLCQSSSLIDHSYWSSQTSPPEAILSTFTLSTSLLPLTSLLAPTGSAITPSHRLVPSSPLLFSSFAEGENRPSTKSTGSNVTISLSPRSSLSPSLPTALSPRKGFILSPPSFIPVTTSSSPKLSASSTLMTSSSLILSSLSISESSLSLSSSSILSPCVTVTSSSSSFDHSCPLISSISLTSNSLPPLLSPTATSPLLSSSSSSPTATTLPLLLPTETALQSSSSSLVSSSVAIDSLSSHLFLLSSAPTLISYPLLSSSSSSSSSLLSTSSISSNVPSSFSLALISSLSETWSSQQAAISPSFQELSTKRICMPSSLSLESHNIIPSLDAKPSLQSFLASIMMSSLVTPTKPSLQKSLSSSSSSSTTDKNMGVIKISSFLSEKAEKLDAIFDFKNATVVSINEGDRTLFSTMCKPRPLPPPLPPLPPPLLFTSPFTVEQEEEIQNLSSKPFLEEHELKIIGTNINTFIPTATTGRGTSEFVCSSAPLSSLSSNILSIKAEVDAMQECTTSPFEQIVITKSLETTDNSIIDILKSHFSIDDHLPTIKEAEILMDNPSYDGSQTDANLELDSALVASDKTPSINDANDTQTNNFEHFLSYELSEEFSPLFEGLPSPDIVDVSHDSSSKTSTGYDMVCSPSKCRANSIKSKFRSLNVSHDMSCLNCLFPVKDLAQLDRHLAVEHPDYS